jgi:hypothetical protein
LGLGSILPHDITPRQVWNNDGVIALSIRAAAASVVTSIGWDRFFPGRRPRVRGRIGSSGGSPEAVKPELVGGEQDGDNQEADPRHRENDQQQRRNRHAHDTQQIQMRAYPLDGAVIASLPCDRHHQAPSLAGVAGDDPRRDGADP